MRSGVKKLKLTVILTAVNIIVFLSSLFYDEVFYYGALMPELVREGEFWRIFSSMFLHADLSHLGTNMISLCLYGYFLEPFCKSFRFGILYFLSGICGGLLVTFCSDPYMVTIGASGAIFGLLGACAVLLWKTRNPRQLTGCIITLFMNLYYTFTTPNISLYGHIGGLIGGILTAFVLFRMKSNREE